jgi:hypothetical protein
MNKSKWLVWAAVLVVIVAVALVMGKWRAPSSPAAPTTSAEIPVPGNVTPQTATPVTPEELVPAPEPVLPKPEPLDYSAPIRESKVLQEGAEPKEIVRVKPEQVLATVNGTPVTLKDLVAVPSAQRGAEQTLSASVYDMLLERAVVREVAVQAAKAQGIALTDDQKAQLEKFKREMLSASPDVIDMTMPPERVAFEQRDTEGRMLLVNLAAQAGAPVAFVTEDLVKSYYEGHKGEYEELPSDPQEAQWAWQRIDRQIRNTLAQDTANAYQQAYDKVVADLKAAASINLTATVAP